MSFQVLHAMVDSQCRDDIRGQTTIGDDGTANLASRQKQGHEGGWRAVRDAEHSQLFRSLGPDSHNLISNQ